VINTSGLIFRLKLKNEGSTNSTITSTYAMARLAKKTRNKIRDTGTVLPICYIKLTQLDCYYYARFEASIFWHW